MWCWLVSRDNEPFMLTVLAHGPHLATWVNGVQVTDWTYMRLRDETPRRGLRTEAGTIQLQAHDPETDLEFGVIAIAPLAEANAVAKPVKELILPGESFLFEGHPAFILMPPEEKRRNPQPWIFYAPTLPGYPTCTRSGCTSRFLAAGVAVAGIDVGEAYGSPQGPRALHAFYRELTGKRGLRGPALPARSQPGRPLGHELGRRESGQGRGDRGIYPVSTSAAIPAWTRPPRPTG